jgi:hypothetical protein
MMIGEREARVVFGPTRESFHIGKLCSKRGPVPLYEAVGVIPQRSRNASGTLVGIGPRLRDILRPPYRRSSQKTPFHELR